MTMIHIILITNKFLYYNIIILLDVCTYKGKKEKYILLFFKTEKTNLFRLVDIFVMILR